MISFRLNQYGGDDSRCGDIVMVLFSSSQLKDIWWGKADCKVLDMDVLIAWYVGVQDI